MAARQSARDAFESSKRTARRLADQAGSKDARKLLERAAADLRRRLEDLGDRGLDDTFTAAQLRATLSQVNGVLADLTRGMGGLLKSNAAEAALNAARHTARYLADAEREFRGVAQPLGLTEARMLSRSARGASASLLGRIAEDPTHPGRPGILQRYGIETVQSFERQLQLGIVAKRSWGEIRDSLVEESPFLQGAPAHWAERIVRTEYMAASNAGAQESIEEAQEQLGDMVKILSATFDDRTAADSYAVHGQIRRPEEPFETWQGAVMHPPARPNDREVVTPHRIAWPIPPYLRWKSAEEVLARWRAEGRKGPPPERPEMTTVPLSRFGK